MENDNKPELGVNDYLAMLPEKGRRMIEDLMELDSLTGVYNRRGLLRKIYEYDNRAERDEFFEMVLVLGDVDGLKEINDNLGHNWGDRYIELVSDVLKERVRPGDVVARIGGDEFVLMLPVQKKDGVVLGGEEIEEGIMEGNGVLAKKLKEIEDEIDIRIKKVTEELPDNREWPKKARGISLGLVVYSGDKFAELVDEETDEVLKKLIEPADERMYRKKRSR